MFISLKCAITLYQTRGGCFKEVLSKDCEGCSLQQTACKRRFGKAQVWDKVYCPDGTAHLIDS
jgi:hypothetical protein